jgi:16S rRNA (cytosine967-C5)-methyltransferase
MSDTCIALPPATDIDTVLEINREVVVQDYSSQRMATFMEPANYQQQNYKVWDCCAASGGKSILAKDTLGNIDLMVTDLRPSIIANLKKRFAAAGITNYNSAVADLSNPINISNLTSHASRLTPSSRLTSHASRFHFIIADVPCSGSGTWGRTPEQLTGFKESEIERYQALQRKIVSNIVPHLQQEGYLLYITCSVFKKENEEMVAFIQSELKLSLVKMETLKGYHQKADTMFAALFVKKV